MRIVKKAWNVFWVVDSTGKMIEAAIGGPRMGYVGERGREYKSLAELRSAFLMD
jgi:hypothetical protein